MATTKTVKIPGLETGKFEPPPAAKNRMSWCGFGETKTGKTSFGLSAGGPLVVVDIDRRLERVIDPFAEQKDIVVYRVDMPKVDPVSRKKDELVLKQAGEMWDKFLTHYDLALKSSMLPGGVRNIVIDTGTELFDLRLMAEFGRLMGINPRDRGGANAEFMEVIRRYEQYNASTIWLHHSKAEWKNVMDERGNEKGTTTGRQIVDGFNRVNSIVQNVVQTSFNDTAKDPRKRFEVTVLRCGVNSKINNLKVTSMDWAIWDEDDKETPIANYGPFAYLSSLAVPGTEPEYGM